MTVSATPLPPQAKVLAITVPELGERPSEFRAKFIEAIRDAAAHAHFDGLLAAVVVEEIFRALPVEEPRL
jgi:hypothetical protein